MRCGQGRIGHQVVGWRAVKKSFPDIFGAGMMRMLGAVLINQNITYVRGSGREASQLTVV